MADCMEATTPLIFNSAIAPTLADYVVRAHVAELGQRIKPYARRQTQPVLPLGFLCQNMGYWCVCVCASGKLPYFVRPDGKLVYLKARGDTPHRVPGQKHRQPRYGAGESC